MPARASRSRSAGASARYQRFQFDYAFQTADLGDLNRVDLIYRW